MQRQLPLPDCSSLKHTTKFHSTFSSVTYTRLLMTLSPTFSNVPISHSSVMSKVPHSIAAEAQLESTACHAGCLFENTVVVHCVNNIHTMKLQNNIYNTLQSLVFFSPHFKNCIQIDTTVMRKRRWFCQYSFFFSWCFDGKKKYLNCFHSTNTTQDVKSLTVHVLK